MTRHKARELQPDPRRAQPYTKPDMTGRITHSDLWTRMNTRWQPGTRTWVQFLAKDPDNSWNDAFPD